jgi:hypothetical protein
LNISMWGHANRKGPVPLPHSICRISSEAGTLHAVGRKAVVDVGTGGQ